MAEFIINDWSQGLISSDDDVNGRKNGFLRMENVELDQNGAVVLTGGTVKLGTVLPNNAHTLFSKFLGTGTPESPQFQWAGVITTGNVYRNLPPSTQTTVVTGGSVTRAAFLALFEYVLICSGTKRIRDDGSSTANLGQGTASAPAVALNGAGVLNASYDYCQVNVFVNSSGGYQARSAPSSFVTIVTVNNKVQVTPTNVSGVQNEVWIFRRGGNLDQFYRVKRITSSYTTPFDDNLSDQDALNSGIILNLLALPVDSTNLPDDILEMVGPISGRVLFFTAKALYFSEPNSPESYVPGQGIFFMGAPQTAESFLFAKKLANNVVLIGTTKDIYRCTGTYLTQSDGTLDVTIRPLSVDAPPLSIDADIYNNQLVYMGAYGWIMCDQYGATIPLCPPNVDVNYYGKTRYGVAGVPILQLSPDSNFRYSCAIIRNKLFTVIPELPLGSPTHRVDVYDFIRKYWRSIRYVSNNAPLMLKSQEDHTIIGFFGNDKFIKRLDDQFTFTFDNGPAVNQTLTLKTPFYDCGLPRNRKDAGTLKFKADTGGNNIALTLWTDGNGAGGGTSLGNINSNGMSEIFIDVLTFLNPNLLKSFQLMFQGTTTVFRLSDISFTYAPRPEQITFYRVPISNFGVASKKRVRTLPFVLDTIGNNVTFTPSIDGVNGSVSVFNIGPKGTVFHFFTTDIFGVDYGGILTCPGYFEFYEQGKPEIVQVLPVPKRFDQLGPDELARYGKVRQFEVNILPFGGTSIPYIIYFQDASVLTGTIAVVDGKQDVYPILFPKTTSGEIERIELGPTSFNFHRFYARIQVVRSGKDTDMEWITLGEQNGPDGLQNA